MSGSKQLQTIGEVSDLFSKEHLSLLKSEGFVPQGWNSLKSLIEFAKRGCVLILQRNDGYRRIFHRTLPEKQNLQEYADPSKDRIIVVVDFNKNSLSPYLLEEGEWDWYFLNDDSKCIQECENKTSFTLTESHLPNCIYFSV